MNRLFLLILLLFLFSCSVKSSDENIEVLSPILEKALNRKDSKFYANFAAFPKERSSFPIGIISSGVGDFTLLESLLSIDQVNNITGEEGSDGILDFAGEDFTLFVDRVNMPYDLYCSKERVDFLQELVVKDALFLLGDKYHENRYEIDPSGIKEPSKIILIGCNIAAAYGNKEVDSLLSKSKSGVKAVGVVNSGVKGVFRALNSNSNSAESRDSIAVGVLSSPGAISSEAYTTEINRCAKESEYLGYIKVVAQTSNDSTVAKDLISLLDKHRKRGASIPLKHIILGITHNPNLVSNLNDTIAHLRDFKQDGVYIYRDLIDPKFSFIDPVEMAALECYNLLREDKKLALRTRDSKVKAFISLPSYGLSNEMLDGKYNLANEYKYGREVGVDNISTIIVPFTRNNIGEEDIEVYFKDFPCSYTKIKNIID